MRIADRSLVKTPAVLKLLTLLATGPETFRPWDVPVFNTSAKAVDHPDVVGEDPTLVDKPPTIGRDAETRSYHKGRITMDRDIFDLLPAFETYSSVPCAISHSVIYKTGNATTLAHRG
jgi:hypothetical protein